MPALRLAGGGTLTYEEYGVGPAIFLIHGSPGTARAWQRVAERLATRFRVIAPNLPGYGGSSAGPEDGDSSHAAEAIGALASALGAPRVLTGYSYGGVVALQAALRGAVRPDALALLEPVAVPVLDALGDPAGYRCARVVFDDYVASVTAGDGAAVRTMVEFWFGPGSFERMPAPMRSFLAEHAQHNARDVAATFRDAYTREGLRRLAMPVLVVLGERSPAVMARICQDIANTVVRGALVRLAQANHALTTTHADQVADLIAEVADGRLPDGGAGPRPP